MTHLVLPMDGIALDSIDLHDAAGRHEAEVFLTAHQATTPFHLPAWSLGVEKATRNRPYLLAARRRDGSLAGLLPLHHIRSTLFGDALAGSGFAVDGGILADDPVAAELLGDAAWALGRKLGVGSVELRGGPSPGAGWTCRWDSHLGFTHPLAADEDAELARIPRKHRAEVRKALANEALTIETGMSRRLLAEHYRIYSTSVRNLGTPVLPAALMREVAAGFGEDADILIVRYRGEAVSAVLSLYHRGVVMPFWGGGTKAARGLRSNELLYFRLMEHARKRGCDTFDFGRSRVGSGQAKWKTSWGFEPRPLSYWHRSAGDARDINPESDRYAKRVELWKKLPLPVANLLGPLISRGLG